MILAISQHHILFMLGTALPTCQVLFELQKLVSLVRHISIRAGELLLDQKPSLPARGRSLELLLNLEYHLMF
jgi:hypothetical protein